MLNYDYKLVSRILKSRVASVIDKNNLLTHSQKCSNAKKNIFEALHAIKDRIAEIRHKKKRARVVSLDLDHAFDRVEHCFLFRVMRDMGFHERLIELLRKIMQNSRSRVLVNGHLSPEFQIGRSVRQGDPISMYLFVIYLHPLLEKLHMICNDPLELVVAYADDITVVIVDDSKLEQIKRTFHEFGQYSGAVLSLSKTIALNIGDLSRPQSVVNWPSVSDSVKILGITFFNDHKVMIEFNWKETIRKMTQLMWMFKPRLIVLHQKIRLLNVYVTSKLWFVASVLSIRNQDVAKVTKHIGTFIWGRKPRVAMNQLIQPVSKGGLNLHLPMYKCKALLANRTLQVREVIPFGNRLITEATNGNNPVFPAMYPCIKVVWRVVQDLPQQVMENICSSAIERHLTQELPIPKIISENPAVRWPSVFQNIHSKHMSAIEKTTMYLFVNQKLPHAQLLYKIGQTTSPNCATCRLTVESQEHKLANCPKVARLWSYLCSKLRLHLNTRIEYSIMKTPEFRDVSRNSRIAVLKLFVKYVVYILEGSIPLNVQELEHILNLN